MGVSLHARSGQISDHALAFVTKAHPDQDCDPAARCGFSAASGQANERADRVENGPAVCALYPSRRGFQERDLLLLCYYTQVYHCAYCSANKYLVRILVSTLYRSYRGDVIYFYRRQQNSQALTKDWSFRCPTAVTGVNVMVFKTSQAKISQGEVHLPPPRPSQSPAADTTSPPPPHLIHQDASGTQPLHPDRATVVEGSKRGWQPGNQSSGVHNILNPTGSPSAPTEGSPQQTIGSTPQYGAQGSPSRPYTLPGQGGASTPRATNTQTHIWSAAATRQIIKAIR